MVTNVYNIIVWFCVFVRRILSLLCSYAELDNVLEIYYRYIPLLRQKNSVHCRP